MTCRQIARTRRISLTKIFCKSSCAVIFKDNHHRFLDISAGSKANPT